MTTLREAARQALEAIEQGETFDYLDKIVSPRLLAALDLPERRLTDAEIGEVWFAAKIPGLTETQARLLIRAAERKLAGEK